MGDTRRHPVAGRVAVIHGPWHRGWRWRRRGQRRGRPSDHAGDHHAHHERVLLLSPRMDGQVGSTLELQTSRATPSSFRRALNTAHGSRGARDGKERCRRTPPHQRLATDHGFAPVRIAARYAFGIGMFLLILWVLSSHRDELSGLATVIADLRWWWVPPALLAELGSFVCFAGMQYGLLNAGGLRPPLGALSQDDIRVAGVDQLPDREWRGGQRLRVPVVPAVWCRRHPGRLVDGWRVGHLDGLALLGRHRRPGVGRRGGCLARPDPGDHRASCW